MSILKQSCIGPGSNPAVKWRILALCHFVNDLPASNIETFAPLLVQKLGISVGMAGLLPSIGGLMHTLVQPVSGFLSDRYGHNRFILFGMIMSGFFGSLIPLSLNMSMALAAVLLWGIGTALFHPQAQGASGYVAMGATAIALSLFSLGGMLGSTIGPLYGIFLYHHLGWASPIAAVILPITAALLCQRAMPHIHQGNAQGQGIGLSLLPQRFGKVFCAIWPVWIITFTRDLARRGLLFLLPMQISFRGGSLAQIGMTILVMSFLSAVVPMMIVRCFKSISARRIIIIAEPLAATLALISTFLPLNWSLPLLVLAGCTEASSLPVTDALAQSLAPEDRSTVSSLTMGASYGLAGLFLSPLGLLADLTNIRTALMVAFCLPLVALPVIFLAWRRYNIQ